MANGNGSRQADDPRGLHVAIIMDGSGRWATARGLPRSEGHRAGRVAVQRTIEAASARGIGTLTLFTFSCDNWQRPVSEVTELLRIFEAFFAADAPDFIPHGVRFSAIGRRDRLPTTLAAAIARVEAASRNGPRLHVRFAIDYSGRDALVRAAEQLATVQQPSAATFSSLVTEAAVVHEVIPDVDLLIRTGGELRLSDCPLWEIAYAELYFTPSLWPDFDGTELAAALEEFRTRDRRFGQIPAEVASI